MKWRDPFLKSGKRLLAEMRFERLTLGDGLLPVVFFEGGDDGGKAVLEIVVRPPP